MNSWLKFVIVVVVGSVIGEVVDLLTGASVLLHSLSGVQDFFHYVVIFATGLVAGGINFKK